VKKDVETGKQGKKNKALWEAYKVAAEGHDLEHFKTVLANHEAAMQQDVEQREQKEIEKKEKAEKSAKRKSTAAADSEDVEMDDADGTAAPSAKKAKATKKRKKGEESDGENEKVWFQLFVCFATTDRLTACKDSQDYTQVEGSKGRIFREAQEGEEEGERRGRTRSARGASDDRGRASSEAREARYANACEIHDALLT
jgi:hypothetical protein